MVEATSMHAGLAKEAHRAKRWREAVKPDSACDDLAAPTGGPQQGAAEMQRGEGTGMRFFARSIPDPFGQPAPKKAESLQLI